MISAVCQGLLSCHRHIGKREDPGDEVGVGADISWFCLPCQPGSPVAKSSRISEQSDVFLVFLFQDAAEDEPSHRPILDPARDESSIAEQTPEPSTAPFALTFKVIEDSTSKGRPKLIDSRGYCYGVKRRRVNATDWICTRRPKVNIISFAFN